MRDIPIQAILRHAAVTAPSAAGNALIALTNSSRRLGVSIYNQDATNAVFIYLVMHGATAPVVGTTVPSYRVPAQTTWEYEGDGTIDIYVGASAGTISVVAEESF